MKDTESTHKKIQEMIDCYAVNDPLKEMSQINAESDPGEAAVKWIALAVRNDSLTLKAKVETEDGGQSLTLKFPE